MKNTKLTPEMFPSPADYWQARAEQAEKRLHELRVKVFTSGDRVLSMKGRTYTVEGDGFVLDNNFDFDAGLSVSGDFIDDEKQQYARMIAAALNSHNIALIDETADENPAGTRLYALTNEQVGNLRAVERMRHDFVPLAEFHRKHALGPMQPPACLVCGETTAPAELDAPFSVAIQHDELRGVVVCKRCRDAALGAT